MRPTPIGTLDVSVIEGTTNGASVFEDNLPIRNLA
jgi:hypothetical protein